MMMMTMMMMMVVLMMKMIFKMVMVLMMIVMVMVMVMMMMMMMMAVVARSKAMHWGAFKSDAIRPRSKVKALPSKDFPKWPSISPHSRVHGRHWAQHKPKMAQLTQKNDSKTQHPSDAAFVSVWSTFAYHTSQMAQLTPKETNPKHPMIRVLVTRSFFPPRDFHGKPNKGPFRIRNLTPHRFHRVFTPNIPKHKMALSSGLSGFISNGPSLRLDPQNISESILSVRGYVVVKGSLEVQSSVSRMFTSQVNVSYSKG